MKEITFPELCGVGNQGKEWGLAEYLLEIVFTQRALYADPEFCELIVELQPKLLKLCGETQVGKKLRVNDDQHKVLVARGLPDQQAQLLPEVQYAVAKCRLALVKAEHVREEATEVKEANGAAKSSKRASA